MTSETERDRQRRRARCIRSILLSACALSGVAAAAPGIEITALPPYGSDGLLQGIVSDVEPQDHVVAPFIHIEGAGWWTKPTFTTPTVPIAADGSFLADVVGGGLDDRATIYCVYVIASDAEVPLADGEGRIPAAIEDLAVARVCTERYVRTLDFAGYEWGVKEAPLPVGPGGNFFSDRASDAYVDDEGRLHMRLTRRSGSWYATEIILTESLGFGTYSFETVSDLDALDPNVVFGAFTWDTYGDGDGPTGSNHREIDSEDTRWRNPSDPNGTQWAIAPYFPPTAVHRYALPDLGTPPYLSRFISWTAEQVVFSALSGRHTPCVQDPANLIDNYIYAHSPPMMQYVPHEGRERFRFNLWLSDNSGPVDGQEVEVIVSGFAFYPIGDSDCDGIEQAVDSCLDIANPSQRDSDADGFGNRCDADLNNDCLVNFADLNIFRSVFLTSDSDADLDGNGNVDFADLAIVRSGFLMPPGPSAVASCP